LNTDQRAVPGSVCRGSNHAAPADERSAFVLGVDIVNDAQEVA
jgi:hypothetical protein